MDSQLQPGDGANPFAPPRSHLLDTPAPRTEAPALTVVAIFNIILGVLTFGWTLMWIAELVLFATGLVPSTPNDEVSNIAAMVMVVFLLVLSIAAGALHLLAGIRLLRPQPGTRGLAIASGIAGTCSFWTCCLWPLAIGAGVWTLVVVLGEAGRRHIP